MRMVDMSGAYQTPEKIRVPSSLEIAVVLGRLCRYAGSLPCTVLTHVMIGARMVWHRMKQEPQDLRLQTFSWWMLHDGHEAITGDFATHKCKDIREWQEQIDEALRSAYSIDMELVDMDVIRSVDMKARWLEVKHYGSEIFVEGFSAAVGYAMPSPEMEIRTVGIFRSEFGRMSACVTDTNNDMLVCHPVSVYESILEAIRHGKQKAAAEFYDGMVVEIGF